MGQHSSKRRSYTPGQDVQSEIPTNSLVNGDVKYDVTANGDVDSHNKDVQMRATKPHAPVERQPSSSSGKKDKSKKIRIIGLTLRRTPSGRWTRKRRSMRANGSARPTSLPVTDLKPKDKGTQPRPQSLFEEEVISEEEGKIETVDLSDNEDNEESKASQATAAAGPVPKPREKKWKRTSSDKRQGGSKKKKDKKKNSKKEKPKRPTSPKTTRAPDVPTTPSEENEAEPAIESPVEEAATQNNEGGKDNIDQVASSIVEQSINIARDRVISEQDVGAGENENEPPRSEGDDNDATDATGTVTVDVDVEAKAKSITTVEIPVEDVIAPPSSVAENESAPTPAPNTEADFPTTPEVDEDMIIPSQSLVREMVPIIFKVDHGSTDDVVEESDKVDENVSEEEVKPQEPIEVQVEVVKNENEEPANEPQLETEMKTGGLLDEITPLLHGVGIVSNETKDDVNRDVVVEESFVQEKVERVKTVPILSVTSPEHDDQTSNENLDTPMETKIDEQMNQQTNMNDDDSKNEISVVAESVKDEVKEIVQNKLDDAKDDDNAATGKDDTAKNSDSEQKPEVEIVSPDNELDKKHKTKHTKEQKESEKAEKERLKKQKEEEKAKEKERVKEEKRKKAEQKSAEKVKLRAHGDRKSTTITKRLSDWFKKDKTKSSDTSSEVKGDDAAGPSAGASANANDDTPSKIIDGTDSQQNASASPLSAPDSCSTGESLTVDVSVQPLPDLAASPSETDQQTTSSSPRPPSPSSRHNSASPDSAPASPVLESSDNYLESDPSSPTSDGEKSGESSGVLKKILLGPRLRTAILRKKSSGASDNGVEEKRVSLTQPKGVETADVTAPPRKLRPRKPVEQYSPITLGAHNPVNKSPSPRLEHKDKDSLQGESEIDTSCHEYLPKKEEDDDDHDDSNVVDEAESSNVVADVVVPVIVTNDVDISSQSLHEHISIEKESNVENSNSNVSVENVEDSQETSSPEKEIIPEVIEKSHTEDVLLQTMPTLDNVVSSEVVKEEIVTSVCDEVKSEIEQTKNTEEESEEKEEDSTLSQEYDDSEAKEEEEEKEEDSTSSQESNDSKAKEGEKGEEKDSMLSQEECSDSVTKDENVSEGELPEKVNSRSRRVVSTASIVLRSSSNEGADAVVDAVLDDETFSESQQVQSDVSVSLPVNASEDMEEVNDESIDAADSKASDKEVDEKNEDKPENKEDAAAPENNVSDVVDILDEVKSAVSDIAAKTSSSSDDEKELDLDKDGEDDDDDDDDDDDVPSKYTVVCTAMATADEPSGDAEEESVEPAPAAPIVDTNEDISDAREVEKAVDTEETVSSNDDEDTTHQEITQEESSDASSGDNNDTTPSTSSSSGDHWESPKLDIQLDDSAIEMDKESPLADAQCSPLISISSFNNKQHEDEGVNSDNSSDNNDNVVGVADQDERSKDNDGDNDDEKADSSDTIEAYLKLQQQHVNVDNVKDVSVSSKNHIVDTTTCALLVDSNSKDGFGLQSPQNGVDDNDESHHKTQEELAPQESSTTS